MFLSMREKERYILLGKLLGKKTCLKMYHLLDAWKLDDRVMKKSLGDGFFLFSFNTKSDMVRAWSRGSVYMEEEAQCLLVRRWSPGLQLDIKIMSYLQVWIQLPALDLHGSVREKAVCNMAYSAGDPIAVDFSSNVIRVCVEVDVNKPLVAGVKAYDGNGEFWKTFRYELSGFCFACGRIDHMRKHCPGVGPRNGGSSSSSSSYVYGNHNLAPRKEHKRQPVQYFSWRPPAAGWVKLNFDGSFKGRTGRAGGGGLLRHDDGSFLAAFAVPLSTSSPLMAEIEALQNGLRLALKLEVKRIFIEGDSKITIEMLNGKQKAEGEEMKCVMDDILEHLQRFKEYESRHKFREANRSADHLANMAARATKSMEWIDNPPPFLASFLDDDQSSTVVPRFIL